MLATLLLLLLLLMLLAACQPAPAELELARQALQQRKQALAAEFTDCPRDSATALAGLVAGSHCLVYTVAENPAEPAGRQLDLQVMVVPAIRPVAEPDPFVILVGGPGQAATLDAVPLVPGFERIRRARDILLIDQRGTGRLSPFDCDYAGDESELIESSAELLLQIQLDQLRECLDSVDADPRYYTTDLAVQDLDAIRNYLGYSALNLWGGSYGTRVALAYLKYFPDHTRTVTIDGVAPPGVLPLEAALDGSRALATVLALCEEESACTAAFPELRLHYRELLQRFAEESLIALRNPVDGRVREVPLSAAGIESTLFLLLYSRETARLIPLLIEELYQQNYQIFEALTGMSGGINIGMHYSVICSEDLPLLDRERLQTERAELMAFEMLVQTRIAGCGFWPTRELDTAFFEPVVADVPVLIFSGSQDPVTPRRWGDQVAATLSNALHVEARGIGHIVSRYGCAPELISDMVETGSLAGLDVSCLDDLHARPFFLTRNGSAAGD